MTYTIKKLCLILLTCAVFLLSGCNGPENYIGADTNLERFEFVERIGYYGDYKWSIIRDTETGVEYIFINGPKTASLTPLIDENGNVVIHDD